MKRNATGSPVLLVLLLLGSARAAAQTTCQAPIGPDLIIGDIQGVANYASNGASLEALALGTYHCNVGTAGVNWFASTNQHPVFGGSLYKYKQVGGAGRFEQLGTSWLQHGFFALSDSLCCTGCQGTDGTHLGVACADPETASRNGSQGGLGPRWQVNPATGAFAYPPANPPWSGSVARRIQVKIAELEPSSASVRYFGEALGIASDDAAAGNSANNASHRALSVTGSGTAWTFALLAGSTVQREKPAILAWPALDPAVQVNTLDIPGDGRVLLASRTTDLGGGLWHYEYALFNLDSDLAIGAFSVPVGAGVVLTNIGFHDVDAFHDGDGPGNVDYDRTDWSASQAGGALTWATQTALQNPSANALRWGTLYNFRFDADVPPNASILTLSTFKVPGSVFATADSPGGPASGGSVSICEPGSAGVLACPCANPPLSAGRGCDNSSSTGGAILTAAGNATLSSDSLVLSTSGEKPTATSIVLQGDASLAAGVVFGQGVRCVAGVLKRLYVVTAVAGSISAPSGAAPRIAARSAALGDTIPSGAHRCYGVYYRDPAVLGGCPLASTFNVTQQLDTTWNP